MAVEINQEDAISIFTDQVAARLRQVRSALGLTQEEVGEKCGMTARVYRQFELGMKPLTLNLLVRFCSEFNQDLAFIVMGERQLPALKAVQNSEAVKEVVSAVLDKFGAAEIPKEKTLNLIDFAMDNAKAKGTSFAEELDKVIMLTS